MRLSWTEFLDALDTWAPERSTRRKMFTLFGIILVIEGISVVFLSSYFGPALGILSVALGVLILVLFPPSIMKSGKAAPELAQAASDPIGVRLVEFVMSKIGGSEVVIALGVLIVALDVAFNSFVSARSEYGDLDTLSIMLGVLMVIYPFAVKKFKLEAIFALLFLALVVVFLVVPQAFMALGNADGSNGSNWYVHYMLAEPFAGALNLVGIHASSVESWVTFAFHDGSVHTLGISTACAGLYSFSIFLSAFFSFILVFERLTSRLTVLVLVLGLFVAYLGNLFRMIVIGVVGYYYGMDSLLWAHKNVGWMIFLSWSAVFWYIVLRYADKKSGIRSRELEVNA